MERKKFFSDLISYFLQGLLLTVPMALTFYIVYTVFRYIDSILPFDIPGLGMLILFSIITLAGFLGNNILVKPFAKIFESLINRAPVLKLIYTSIKDLVSAIVGKERKFGKPVLVDLESIGEYQRIGFIANKDLSVLNLPKDKVAVYLPHSYAWSGNLIIVSESKIKPLDMSASRAMKFIVSGGVSIG